MAVETRGVARRPEGLGQTMALLLALVFERRELALLCWGGDWPAWLPAWPSGFYRFVAESACGSEACWQRIAPTLHARLSATAASLEELPPLEIARALRERGALMQWRELAATLWRLVRSGNGVFEHEIAKQWPDLVGPGGDGKRPRE